MNLKNCIIESVSTRKDRSVKIVLSTMEMTPSQLAELLVSVNNEITAVELPQDSSEPKSKSTRLRSVLYRLWEAKHKEKFQTFELYYNHIMEQLIDHYKQLID